LSTSYPMNAPEPTYASFPLVLSQKSYPFRLPAYRASHLGRYHPYPRSRSSRALDYDDPLMVSSWIIRPSRTPSNSRVWQRTIDTPYDGPRLDHLLVGLPSLVLWLPNLIYLIWQPTIEGENADGEVINLHDALSAKDGRALVRHISLSTLVVVFVASFIFSRAVDDDSFIGFGSCCQAQAGESPSRPKGNRTSIRHADLKFRGRFLTYWLKGILKVLPSASVRYHPIPFAGSFYISTFIH
jgi:hypothetical protein